ncbi:MAG: hypothetical protein OEZ13_07885 [Spirochaetia bacterium]|nr:hypothetical protein [Spirochaetia bacterium]
MKGVFTKRYLFIWLLLNFSLFFFCSPSTEDYILKAKTELAKENSINAFRYFQKAYESSLPDEYFLLDRDRSFSTFALSAKREHAIFLEEKENKKGKINQFEIIDFVNDERFGAEIKGEVYSLSLSPSGKYAVFLTDPDANKNLMLKSTVENENEDDEKKCAILIWDIAKEEYHPIENLPLNCREKPAVSDFGLILFVQDEKIMAYDIKKNPYVRQYIENSLDKTLNDITNLGSVFYSASNTPYLLYGNFGTYTLYSIKDKNIQKITDKASFNKVYFLVSEEHIGVFTGGASEHKIDFFSNDSKNSLYQIETQSWKDAAFISPEHYYFLKKNRLVEAKNAGIAEIPFWATKIYAGKSTEIYFLSSLGTAMKYAGKKPPPDSVVIFKTANELDEIGD